MDSPRDDDEPDGLYTWRSLEPGGKDALLVKEGNRFDKVEGGDSNN
jgi:hypothetical protein